MSYDNFEASFTKANRNLKIVQSITLLVATILIAMLFFHKRYYIYKGGPIFEERPLAEEICRQGFVTIAGGSPNPFLVMDEIIEMVKAEPFDVRIDKLLQVVSLEKGACKIVLLSEGKLLAFKINLDGGHSNPFYYKLMQIDEIPAKEVEE
jgi:hypothetical protein